MLLAARNRKLSKGFGGTEGFFHSCSNYPSYRYLSLPAMPCAVCLSSLVCWFLSSCLLPHGGNIAAKPSDIISTFKAGKRKKGSDSCDFSIHLGKQNLPWQTFISPLGMVAADHPHGGRIYSFGMFQVFHDTTHQVADPVLGFGEREGADVNGRQGHFHGSLGETMGHDTADPQSAFCQRLPTHLVNMDHLASGIGLLISCPW